MISVVDNTQGVVWEMFHHSEYYNKIVFWVDSQEKLCKLVNMIAETNESDLSPQLYYCIRVLNDRNISFPFVFWIKDNRCYYEMDVNKVSTLLSTKTNYASKFFFDIESQLDICVSGKKTTGANYYEDWNRYSIVISKVSMFFNLVNTKLPLGLFAFMLLCSLLVCLTLMVGIICASIASIIKDDVLSGIIGFIFSISILAMSVFGWNKIWRK